MPIIQDEWHRRKARNSGSHKSAHFAKQNLQGGPSQQTWQNRGNNNASSPSQQQVNPRWTPAPFKKFGKRPNKQPYQGNSYPGNNQSAGPNLKMNQQNRQNKKWAHNAVLEENKALKAQLEKKAEASEKDKGKSKSVNFAALPMARIDELDDTNSIIN